MTIIRITSPCSISYTWSLNLAYSTATSSDPAIFLCSNLSLEDAMTFCSAPSTSVAPPTKAVRRVSCLNPTASTALSRSPMRRLPVTLYKSAIVKVVWSCRSMRRNQKRDWAKDTGSLFIKLSGGSSCTVGGGGIVTFCGLAASATSIHDAFEDRPVEMADGRRSDSVSGSSVVVEGVWAPEVGCWATGRGVGAGVGADTGAVVGFAAAFGVALALLPLPMLAMIFSGRFSRACSLRLAIEDPPRIFSTGRSTFSSLTNQDRTSTAIKLSIPRSMRGPFSSTSLSVICRMTRSLAMNAAVPRRG